MKQFFLAVAFLATLVCGVAAFLGLAVAMKAKTPASLGFCFVGALILLALMGSTRDIFGHPSSFHKSLKPFWFVAFFMTAGTVLLAGCCHLIMNQPLLKPEPFEWSQVMESDWLQRITLIVFTALLTGAPIALSNLRSTLEDEEPKKAADAEKAPTN